MVNIGSLKSNHPYPLSYIALFFSQAICTLVVLHLGSPDFIMIKRYDGGKPKQFYDAEMILLSLGENTPLHYIFIKFSVDLSHMHGAK